MPSREPRFHIDGPGGREAIQLPSLGAVLSRAIGQASRAAAGRRVAVFDVLEWGEVIHTVETTSDRAVLVYNANRARARTTPAELTSTEQADRMDSNYAHGRPIAEGLESVQLTIRRTDDCAGRDEGGF